MKIASPSQNFIEENLYTARAFTISINNIRNGGATLDFMWDNTLVSVPFTVPTDEKVMNSIKETVYDEPTARDYYSAAVYFLQEDKDINQAKTWIDESMAMTEEPAFWQLRQQSLIYAKSGDKEGAINLAEQSLAKAVAAGNDQYVKFNEQSLKEWKKK